MQYPGNGNHPHSRGVNSTGVWQNSDPVGSSPRAGFTKPSASAKSVTTDHPRACGVYVMLPSVMVRTGGSSPRVRGLRHPGAAEQLDGGIIPARAGFTQRLVQRAVWRGDHPRACGVYAPVAPRRWYAAGSSPHARGLLPLAVLLDGAVGIIPARAGFTPPGPCTSCVTGDHPRTRGVYYWEQYGKPVAEGSSPHARGLLGHVGGVVAVGGIIPARAGFTPQGQLPHACTTDHPRTRGVYLDSNQ